MLNKIIKPGNLVIARKNDFAQEMFNTTSKTCYIPGQISTILEMTKSAKGSYRLFITFLTKDKINYVSLGQKSFFLVFEIVS